MQPFAGNSVSARGADRRGVFLAAAGRPSHPLSCVHGRISLCPRWDGNPSELCNEAIRLATILAEHPAGHVPETFALLALMHLHTARMAARQDSSGGLLLLEEQDRECWDPHGMQAGLEWLAKSSEGDR